MADRLGPRACVVCGPGHIEGCHRCGATMGHRHVTVLDRHGDTAVQVAVCRSHVSAPIDLPDNGELAGEAESTFATTTRVYATAAPKAVMADRTGRRHDYGAIVTWWKSDLVVHALRNRTSWRDRNATYCGWPVGDRARVPLGWALQVARPCRVCWTGGDG